MSQSLLNTIYLAAAFLVLFGTAEILYHFLHVRASVTRKLVHVCTGLLTLLFPPLIGDHWLVLGLCGSFLMILLVSIPLKLLPSINAVDRVTRGSLLYPVIVYISFLAYLHYSGFVYYYIPILTLALCDPIAELVGKNFPYGRYRFLGHTKTLSGSTGFFLSSLILSFILLLQLTSLNTSDALRISFILGISTAVAEGVSHKGYDNLTIPFTAMGVLVLFHELQYF